MKPHRVIAAVMHRYDLRALPFRRCGCVSAAARISRVHAILSVSPSSLCTVEVDYPASQPHTHWSRQERACPCVDPESVPLSSRASPLYRHSSGLSSVMTNYEVRDRVVELVVVSFARPDAARVHSESTPLPRIRCVAN